MLLGKLTIKIVAKSATWSRKCCVARKAKKMKIKAKGQQLAPRHSNVLIEKHFIIPQKIFFICGIVWMEYINPVKGAAEIYALSQKKRDREPQV